MAVRDTYSDILPVRGPNTINTTIYYVEWARVQAAADSRPSDDDASHDVPRSTKRFPCLEGVYENRKENGPKEAGRMGGRETSKKALFPYLIPSVRPGADSGAQAVSPQVTLSHPPSGRLPLLSARPTATFPTKQRHHPLAGTKLYCLVTSRHVRVSSLLEAVTWKRTGRDSNPRPFGSRANALPLRHIGHLNG